MSFLMKNTVQFSVVDCILINTFIFHSGPHPVFATLEKYRQQLSVGQKLSRQNRISRGIIAKLSRGIIASLPLPPLAGPAREVDLLQPEHVPGGLCGGE